jgi:oligosaccharide 4-alpha-D-glucosyltransferase
MRAQVPIVLNMGICGIPFMHYDMCGFTGGIDDELYTRWFQMGTFAPIMRSHGTGEPPEPVFRSEQTKEIVREYAKLRHRLLPYNYTLAWEAALTGMPLARPMFFYDNDDMAYVYADYQYFWGESFLLAPVLNQGQTVTYTYLPEGQWIEYHSDLTYSGGDPQPVSSPISRMPLLVKAGSIIPLSTDFQTIKDYSTSFLSIQYYPDESVGSTSYTMYHDDGLYASSIEEGQYELIDMSASYAGEFMQFHFSREENNFSAPSQRTIELVLHRCQAPSLVRYDEETVSRVFTELDYNTADEAWYVLEEKDHVYVKFEWDGQDALIEAEDLELRKSFADNEGPADMVSFSLFPNPARDAVQLEVTGISGDHSTVTVFDMTGKPVLYEPLSSKEFSMQKVRLSTGHLSPGIYFIEITAGQSRKTRKLIIL